MSHALLSIRNVSKHFGGLHVLQDVNFEVPAGSIFGLIGPNGAGKTTVFNLVTGLLQPNGGSIDFQGESLLGLPSHRITHRGIARTFQNIRVFKEMDLLENVMVGLHDHLEYGTLGMLLNTPGYRRAEKRARERALELLTWVGLDHKADLLADSLSYGDQRKLEFARALATEPKLLLLDEPVAGMTDAETEATAQLILDLARDGTRSLVVVEHDMEFVSALGAKVTVLHEGSVLAEGSLDTIQADAKVVEVYLGR